MNDLLVKPGLTATLDKPWYDASKINEFRTCPQKYYDHYVKGLVTEEISHHLKFGIGIHASLESLYKGTFHELIPHESEFAKGGEIRRGLALFLDTFTKEYESSYKTQLSGLEILACYIRKYREEPFDVQAVEQTFCLDFGTFYYVGKIDLIVLWDGKTMPTDHKTTSRFGPQFESQFKVDTQISGYITAVRRLLDPKCDSAMINALRITKVIDPAESFMRRITTRQSWELEAWEEELRHTIKEIEASMETGQWPRDGQRCFDYNSMCPYYNLCLTHPVGRPPLEEANYRVEHWEPL